MSRQSTRWGPLDPRYATVPPSPIETARADHILDAAHQDSFRRAVLNILSTDIAKTTFAQLVDGLPLSDVAFANSGHRNTIYDPVYRHKVLCPGIREKTESFRKSFEPVAMELDVEVCTFSGPGQRLRNGSQSKSHLLM